MNNITKKLLLNLNKNIKNYPHNKVIPNIENFSIIKYFFSPVNTQIKYNNFFNNNILLKNITSIRTSGFATEGHKLLNFITKILKSFFNSLNCIISKPKFIFMPNKLIIRINYYTTPNTNLLTNKNNNVFNFVSNNEVLTRQIKNTNIHLNTNLENSFIYQLNKQVHSSNLNLLLKINNYKINSIINKVNKIVNQTLSSNSGSAHNTLLLKKTNKITKSNNKELIKSYLNDLINLNINNINTILFKNNNILTTPISKAKSEINYNIKNNIFNIIPYNIIEKSNNNTDTINSNLTKLFKLIFKNIPKITYKNKKNSSLLTSPSKGNTYRNLKINYFKKKYLKKHTSVLPFFSYLHNNLMNFSTSSLSKKKGGKMLNLNLVKSSKNSPNSYNKIKKYNKLLRKLNYNKKKFYENKYKNRIFLGSNNNTNLTSIAMQNKSINNSSLTNSGTATLDYYNISKIFTNIIEKDSSVINSASQINQNLIFILLLVIGNNIIKEYNNLIKFIIFNSKLVPGLLKAKYNINKLNINLLKYLLLIKLNKQYIDTKELNKFIIIFFYYFSGYEAITNIYLNTLTKPEIGVALSNNTVKNNINNSLSTFRFFNMYTSNLSNKDSNLILQLKINKIKEIFLSYLKLLNIKSISDSAFITSPIIYSQGLAYLRSNNELTNNILKNNNIRFKFLGILLSKILGKNVELQMIKLHNVGLDKTILAQIISSNSKKYKLRILLKNLWKKIKISNSKSLLANATSIIKSNKNIKINKSFNKLVNELINNNNKGMKNLIIYNPKINNIKTLKKLWLNSNRVNINNIINKLTNLFIYNNNITTGSTIGTNTIKNLINNPLIATKITGIKIKVSGRLNKERIIPRKTVKTIQIGNLNKKYVSFVDSASYLSKNKKGSFNVKVWMSHTYK